MKNKPVIVFVIVLVILGILFFVDPFFWLHDKPEIKLTAPSFSNSHGVMGEVVRAYDLKIYNYLSIFPDGYVEYIARENNDKTIHTGPVGVFVDHDSMIELAESYTIWGQKCDPDDTAYFYTDGYSFIVPIILDSDDPELLEECSKYYPASLPGYQVAVAKGDGNYLITVTQTDIPVKFILK